MQSRSAVKNVKIDEKLQRDAPVVVPYVISMEHPLNLFCVES